MKSLRKDHTQQFLFEMTNQLIINFFHRHYTIFDGDILFLEKSSVILLITNKKWVELMSKASYVHDEWRISETKRRREVRNRKFYMLKHLCASIFAKKVLYLTVLNTIKFFNAKKHLFKKLIFNVLKYLRLTSVESNISRVTVANIDNKYVKMK